jgi:ABC-type sugar transport system substrate-binding protein
MGDKRIALCLADPSNDFQQVLKADAETAAGRAGLGLDVYFTGHDLAAQLTRLRACIDAGPARPDAILVLAVRDLGLDRVVREAARAGIGFVYLNRTEDDLDEIRKELPASTVGTVSVDEVETGRIQGRQFRALLPAGRMVLCVQGSTRSLAARDRTAGMLEAVKGAPFEVARVDGGWSAPEAREAVYRWLAIVVRSNRRVELVGCQNDPMAMGSIEALKAVADEMQRPEVARIPVTGCDGTPSVGQRLVREGKLVATIVLPSPAGPAVDWIARKLLKGEQPPPLATLKPVSFPEEASLRPLSGA